MTLTVHNPCSSALAIGVAGMLLLGMCACGGGAGLNADTPLVMLLLDTSGSLERKANCVCETPGCGECLPDCSKGERNRYTDLLEVLTGSFEDFSCERIDRDERALGPDAYDLGYYLPYHRPAGRQRSDGILDRYRDQLRFGMATFDGTDTWSGAAPLVARDEYDFELSAQEAGLWSYNAAHEIADFVPDDGEPHGSIRYPNTVTTYFMDTGIRNTHADTGALRIAVDPADAPEVNEREQRSLLSLRPYGGTPVAASLDDMYDLLTQDPKLADLRERSVPIHVVLITDGYPDDDYREFGCNCSAESFDGCVLRGMKVDPPTICPYPTPEDAAYWLICGREDGPCVGPATSVHVVQFSDSNQDVSYRLTGIALSGGERAAHPAGSSAELRGELTSILESILESATP